MPILPLRARRERRLAKASARSPLTEPIRAAALYNALISPRSVRAAVVGLFLFATLWAAYVAQAVLIPLAIAWILYFVMAPVVRFLRRLLPGAIAAFLVVSLLAGTIGTGIYYLNSPLQTWMVELPTVVDKLRTKLQRLRAPVEKVIDASEKVGKMATMDTQESPTVKVETPSLLSRIASNLPVALSQIVFVVILLYFLLASGDRYVRNIVSILPHVKNKKAATELAINIERQVSTYLFSISLINIGLGAAVALCLSWIGMPNAVLWGVVAGLLNFIPYLGAVVSTVLLAMAGIIHFDTTMGMLLPPVIQVALNTIETYVVTPAIVGHNLAMSPVVILIGVAFSAWLWGPFGALLAVPLMIQIQVAANHFDRHRPLEDGEERAHEATAPSAESLAG